MLSRYKETQNFISLPWSNDCYLVNNKGDIISRDNEQVDCILLNGERICVELDWFNGRGLYDLAYIIATAFKPIWISQSQLHLAEVMFEDKDVENLHPSNLIWKFPKGLEHPDHPGYAYIPGFTRYGISKNTEVKNLITGVDKKSFKDRDGYHSYSGLPDVSLNENTSYKFFRHRAMCLAWFDYPCNVESLYVNHKDEIPGNDTLENLEWITPRGNVVYSNSNKDSERRKIILENEKQYTLDIIVRNAKTNEIVIYGKPSDCATDLNIEQDALYHRLKYKPGDKIWHDYKQFQWLSEFKPWREPTDIETEYVEFINGSAILVKDMFTGVVTEFKSARDCSLKMGYSELTISVRLRSNEIKIFSDGCAFKRKSDGRPWPDLVNTKEELQRKIPVWAKNINTEQEFSFESLASCEKTTGVKWSVMLSMKNGRIKNLPFRGWQFSFDGTFKKYSDKILNYFKQLETEKRSFRGNGYLLRNIKTNECRIITSPADLSLEFGYARQYIPTMARRKSIVGGVWELSLYFDKSEIRLMVN